MFLYVCYLVVQANLFSVLSGMHWFESVKTEGDKHMVSCNLDKDSTITSFLFIATVLCASTSIFTLLMKLFVKSYTAQLIGLSGLLYCPHRADRLRHAVLNKPDLI